MPIVGEQDLSELHAGWDRPFACIIAEIENDKSPFAIIVGSFCRSRDRVGKDLKVITVKKAEVAVNLVIAA